MADKPQISERPWSMWSSADYTLEQYAAACLVSPPADQLKSKIQCKLPIKTPDGVLNRAGVHAAAAALAGARGGVQLSPEERALAKKKLRAAYKKLNEEPPPSLAHALVAMIEALEEDAQQHGIKGMKWGVRRDSPSDHSVFTSVGGRKPRVGDKVTQNGESQTVVRTTKHPAGGHIVTTRPTAALKMERAAAGQRKAHIFMKDKEYWKKAAAVAAVGVTGLAAAAVVPAVLPAATLAAAGGPAVISAKIAFSTAAATRIGYAHNYVQWARRSGAASRLRHDAMSDSRTVGQVYDDLTPEKKLAANLLIDAYSRGEEFADDSDVQKGWAAMTPIERSVVLFIASGNEPPKDAIAHSELNDLEPVEWVEEGELEHHGIKGMKWGVRRAVDSATGRVEQTGSTGLKPRMSSADQIAQDRIAAKIKAGGAKAVSNADIQAYTRRLQLQKDLDRVLAEQSAAEKAKADGFIKTFVKKQAGRQVNRVIDKSLDVAVEAALNQAGIKVKKNNPLLGQGMQDVSKRLKPKKG